MSDSIDRLKALNVTPSQAERIFEIPPDMLEQALEMDPAPRWLLFCLDALERALKAKQPSTGGFAKPANENPALGDDDDDDDDFIEPLDADDNVLPASKQDSASLSQPERIAELIFPLLTEAARQRQFVTYDDLDAVMTAAKLDAGDPDDLARYTAPLAILCETILTLSEKSEHRIPPVAALAVIEADGLPIDDLDEYIRIYLIETDRAGLSMRMSSARDEIIPETVFPEIFEFDHWDLIPKEIKAD